MADSHTLTLSRLKESRRLPQAIHEALTEEYETDGYIKPDNGSGYFFCPTTTGDVRRMFHCSEDFIYPPKVLGNEDPQADSRNLVPMGANGYLVDLDAPDIADDEDEVSYFALELAATWLVVDFHKARQRTLVTQRDDEDPETLSDFLPYEVKRPRKLWHHQTGDKGGHLGTRARDFEPQYRSSKPPAPEPLVQIVYHQAYA